MQLHSRHTWPPLVLFTAEITSLPGQGWEKVELICEFYFIVSRRLIWYPHFLTQQICSQIHSASTSSTEPAASTPFTRLSDIDFCYTAFMFTNQTPPLIHQPPSLTPTRTPHACAISFKNGTKPSVSSVPCNFAFKNHDPYSASMLYHIYSICLFLMFEYVWS